MNPSMRLLLSCVLLCLTASASADDGYLAYGFIGGWAYTTKGTVDNGGPLDFQRDLGLRTTARRDYALGYAPATTGWIPAVDFDYLRIGTRGVQHFNGASVVGLPVIPASTTNSSAEINDFELSARWPWLWRDFRFSGGLTLTQLDGAVIAANARNGVSEREKISQLFPLASVAVSWQPIDRLRLSMHGDYIEYQGNRAQSLEASIFWRMLGPVGLEGGYRQRSYKIHEGNYLLDARLSGARIGIRMEIPH